MAFTPPPHPNTRPRVDGRAPDNAGDRAFVAEWLAHLAAGRIGSLCRPTASLSDAEREAADALRAIHEANARIFRGRR